MNRVRIQAVFGVVSIAIASLFTSGCLLLNGYDESEGITESEPGAGCSEGARCGGSGDVKEVGETKQPLTESDVDDPQDEDATDEDATDQEIIEDAPATDREIRKSP